MRLVRALRLSLLLPALLSLSCGGGARGPVEGPHPPPVETQASPVPPPPPPGPSRPLDVTLPGARFVVRVSGQKLASSHLLDPLRLIAKATPAGEVLDLAKKGCGFDPVAAIDELVLSETPDKEMLFAARVSVSPDEALACVKAIAGGHGGQTVAGQAAISLDDGRVVTFSNGMLIGGERSRLEQLMSGPPGPGSDQTKSLDSSPDAILSLVADVHDDPVDRLQATLLQTATKLSLDVTATTPSADHAQKLVVAVDEIRKRLAGEVRGDASVSGFAETLTQSLQVSSEGAALHATFGVTGDGAAQMQFLGKASALMAFGARQYLLRAKVAEARSNLRALERAAVVYAEAQVAKGKPKNAKFPPSAPRTPPEVPRGAKAHVTSWDAPGWKSLGFAPDFPLFYAYSTITSKDGKKITLRAEGDLDGDGKTSKLETTLLIKPDGSIELGSGVVVVDELE